jgi:hypothetical protein
MPSGTGAAGPPRRARGPSLGVGRIAIIVVILLAVAAGAYGVVWMLRHAGPVGDDEDAALSVKSDFNFQFDYPSKEWKQDRKVKLAFGANLAVKRSEPSAWVAIFAHDYKTRTPRASEMHYQLVWWLEKYFRGVEWEAKPVAMLDGLPARRVEFQGEADNVLMNGECLMLSRRGYGYWVMMWAPFDRRDMTAEEWPAVRGGFHFLGAREGWHEKKPEQIAVKGEKAPYRLTYTKGVWEKQSLDGLDPNADLLLRGWDAKEENRLATTAGTVTVLKLPRGEGDLKAAAASVRTYFLAKQKEAGYPDTRIEVVTEKSGSTEGPAEFGAARGHLARLRVKNSESRELYVELATLWLPDGVLVLQCECLWPRRDFWRQEFAQLRDTLRLGKDD